MFRICIYKGYGMYESDGAILYRVLSRYACQKKYKVSYISPEEIVSGSLTNETSLLVIGGGFDLGLIKVLGVKGMAKIKDYVRNGGSYLGICSGAYFACDYIEFDRGGPLEVIGERFLKFYPGPSYGPLYKPYDYKTRSGAAASLIYFHPELGPVVNSQARLNGEPVKQIEEDTKGELVKQIEQPMNDETVKQIEGHLNGEQAQPKFIREEIANGELVKQIEEHLNGEPVKPKWLTEEIANGEPVERITEEEGVNGKPEMLFKVYFNGGGWFAGKNKNISTTMKHRTESHVDGICDNKEHQTNDEQCLPFDGVTVLARYADLESKPAAIVKCVVDKGMAILSGVHFEYDVIDIDDGDILVKNILPELKLSEINRKCLILSILKDLNILTQEF